MTDFAIDEEIAQRLQKIAEQEERPVNAVLRSMLEKYPVQPSDSEIVEPSDSEIVEPSDSESIQSMLDAFDKRAAETSPLEAFIGMFDVDVTDLSIKATKRMGDYYQKKHDDSD